jgi:hypothetical protein
MPRNRGCVRRKRSKKTGYSQGDRPPERPEGKEQDAKYEPHVRKPISIAVDHCRVFLVSHKTFLLCLQVTPCAAVSLQGGEGCVDRYE